MDRGLKVECIILKCCQIVNLWKGGLGGPPQNIFTKTSIKSDHPMYFYIYESN